MSQEDAGTQLAGPRGGMLSSPNLRVPKPDPPRVLQWGADVLGHPVSRVQMIPGGGSESNPLPAALAPGERTRLWAPALCGDLALIPGVARAVLALPVAVAAALVRAVGELAEFVLQVGDALLLSLDCLLQDTDLLQHLL